MMAWPPDTAETPVGVPEPILGQEKGIGEDLGAVRAYLKGCGLSGNEIARAAA
jgi:hypothetical protein